MLNKLKKIDWGIFAILICLGFISVISIHSAIDGQSSNYADTDMRTIIFYVVGLLLAVFVTIFDYRVLLKTWHVLYAIGVIMLVLIFFVGSNLNGATGWFRLGSFSFQPAEAVKIIIIIGVAYLLGRKQGEKLNFISDIIPIGAFVFIPFALVMVQPDLGNAIIYLVILLGMLWIGNVKYSHVLIGLTAVIAGIVLFMTLFTVFNADIKDYLYDHGKKHWYSRINTFVNPEEATADEKHQSQNAQIAIGSGGLSGDGYMEGDMKKGGFIPYPYSDSIFVVIGEEFGFTGAAVLLMLYFLLIYRIIMIAYQCYDRRASYIVIGIASMYVFQIFQNIGMMIGLMPITGITLPFISYGGTSLLLNMICIGIVFSIKAHQEVYELADELA